MWFCVHSLPYAHHPLPPSVPSNLVSTFPPHQPKHISAFDDALDLATVTRMEAQYASAFGSLGDSAQQLGASVASGRWLLHSLAAVSWLASRLCAALIAGPPVRVHAVTCFPQMGRLGRGQGWVGRGGG